MNVALIKNFIATFVVRGLGTKAISTLIWASYTNNYQKKAPYTIDIGRGVKKNCLITIDKCVNV